MKNPFSEKAQKSLEKVIEAFQQGTIAEKCATATFPMPNIPSALWSINNRWLCLIQTGEVDCRGFRQWKEAGRQVKKGESSAYILRPCLVKETDPETDEEIERCIGFSPVPVFAAHQTEGESLEYENIELPELPLMDVAKYWDLEVKAQPFSGKNYGYFSPSQNNIVLFTPEDKVFFHELCHAAHCRIKGNLKPGQDPIQEIVAELGSEVLRRLVGADRDTSGNTYAYIENYADKQGKTVLNACLKVLQETSKVVELILETADSLTKPSSAEVCDLVA